MVVATPDEGVAMGTRKRRSDRAGRGILHSPGRPGGARREDRRQFWAAIAAALTRELRRNPATRGGGLDYRATTAQWHAERAARRPKPARLGAHPAPRGYVEEGLGGG